MLKQLYKTLKIYFPNTKHTGEIQIFHKKEGLIVQHKVFYGQYIIPTLIIIFCSFLLLHSNSFFDIIMPVLLIVTLSSHYINKYNKEDVNKKIFNITNNVIFIYNSQKKAIYFDLKVIKEVETKKNQVSNKSIIIFHTDNESYRLKEEMLDTDVSRITEALKKISSTNQSININKNIVSESPKKDISITETFQFEDIQEIKLNDRDIDYIAKHWNIKDELSVFEKDYKIITTAKIKKKYVTQIREATMEGSASFSYEYNIQINDNDIIKVPKYIFNSAIINSDVVLEYIKSTKMLFRCSSFTKNKNILKEEEHSERRVRLDEKKHLIWAYNSITKEERPYETFSIIFVGVLLSIPIEWLTGIGSASVICGIFIRLLYEPIYHINVFLRKRKAKDIMYRGFVKITRLTLIDFYKIIDENSYYWVIIGGKNKEVYICDDIPNMDIGDYVELLHNPYQENIIHVNIIEKAKYQEII